MDAAFIDARFRDPSLSNDERVADLLSRMTLDEKVAQLAGVWPRFPDGAEFDVEDARRRLANGIGHISRIAASSLMGPRELAAMANSYQRFLVEETRLGIPAIVHEESCAGFSAKAATVFPQAIGMASTWNPQLVEEAAVVMREQMRAVGARQTLAPVLDIVRDGRWGRCEETFGEDPYLASRLGVAYVRGIQGDDLKDGVAATGKHFLGYGASEGGLNWAPVHVPPRELREIYAVPFEAAIREAGLATIMNSYSEIDGEPCGGSRAILTDLLRGELGFEGAVVADYFTVRTLQNYHHVAADEAGAAARALNAGLDVELPAFDCFRHLPRAVEQRLVDIATIETAVARVLRLKFALGLFETPYVDEDAAPNVFDTVEQRSLARRIAAQSMVLLKNDGTLPLRKDIATIAVIGPAADDIRLLQGDYHYPTHQEIVFGAMSDGGEAIDAASAEMAPTELASARRADLREHFTPHVTPLAGVRAATTASVTYARGCSAFSDDRSGIAESVAAAAAADVAVVCVGTRSGLTEGSTSGEASDRSDLRLTAAQRQLVDDVLATGTPTVVVLVNGGILAIPDIAERANAIVEAWLPGEEGGSALADVLFGDFTPSGRLPVSLPRATGQMPVYYNHKPSGGRTNWRTHYVDGEATPLYPFGHGLSYTEFRYHDLAVTPATPSVDGDLEVSISVTNTGERDGEEVVQLYVHDVLASTTRPVKQLAGFARVELRAGETRRVTFGLSLTQLALYDVDMRLVIEPGALEVMVGASSDDIRAQAVVDVSGSVREIRRQAVTSTSVTVSAAAD